MFDTLIINPFITFITFLYATLGNNIVLAIVVFTLVVRVLTYPLTIQQQRSSREMQKIQPQLKKLREKHKGDREKFSQAQMALYREHKINPLGGCLPLVIQMPILLGLYSSIMNVLASTPTQLIALNDRLLMPSLGTLVPLEKVWLGMDLTLAPTANPFYALSLPLLVMGTTWLQSKLTMGNQPKPEKRDDGKPDQSAAMQQSMTTMMPLMFGFFSLSFSVGLSIYFIVSNVIGIVQYGWTARNDKSKEALSEEEARMLGNKRRRRRRELSEAAEAQGAAASDATEPTSAPAVNANSLLSALLPSVFRRRQEEGLPEANEAAPESQPTANQTVAKQAQPHKPLTDDEAQRRKERRRQILSLADEAEDGD
ncbi:MAG: YidC/Oxa1 family membrane protein insertase [Chloroflexi bacterium]|nr:YidC/Oxa1 family membrane protein insertase [Chloroflexota bacterium]